MNPWWLRPPADESTDSEPERTSRRSSPRRQPKVAARDRDRASSHGNGQQSKGPGSNGKPRRNRAPRTSPSAGDGRRDRRIGLFCDVEDIALGLRETGTREFDVQLVVKSLLQRGSIVVRRAYADWGRFRDLKHRYHEAGFELIDIPRKYHSGKSSSDIKLAVDAIELSFSKHHVDSFAILSGDADLCPLISKLRENGNFVIGIGLEGHGSKTLFDCCDEYVFSRELIQRLAGTGPLNDLSPQRAEAFSIVVDAIRSLMSENRDRIWGSMIKQTIQRSQPSFSETAYGYSAFSDLLEDAETCNVIRLERDDRSGSYVVTDFREL